MTTACPADSLLNAGTVCRAANGACDVVEQVNNYSFDWCFVNFVNFVHVDCGFGLNRNEFFYFSVMACRARVLPTLSVLRARNVAPLLTCATFRKYVILLSRVCLMMICSLNVFVFVFAIAF